LFNAKGGCEEDVRHRTKAARRKWKDLSSEVCGRKMSAKVKRQVYRIQIRLVMQNKAEAWTQRRKKEHLGKSSNANATLDAVSYYER
jgi:hypothetical protein